MTARSVETPDRQAGTISANRFFRKLFVITMTYAALTVLAGMPTWIGLIQSSSRLYRMTPYVLVTMVPFTLLVDFVALWWFSQPIRAGLSCIEEGGCTPQVLDAALIRALNFPMLTFVRVMFIHLPAGFLAGFVVFSLLSERMGVLLTGSTLAFLLTMGTVISITHAILEYFAVQRAVEPVIPYLAERLPSRPRDLQSRTKMVGIQTQLLFIMAAIAIIPLIIMAVNILYRSVLPLGPESAPLDAMNVPSLLMPMVGVLIYALVFMGFIAFLLARHTRTLLGRVIHAMGRVQVGDLSPHLDIVTADEFADLYAGFNEMTEGLRERARLHDAFGRYVSPDLAKRIHSEGIILTGQTVEASVMFVDIRDFTAISEHMPPYEVVSLLNSYFARIEPIIKEEEGWINRFMGDGFMAVWGAPVPCDDHAERAVRAARTIAETTRVFNAESTHDRPELRIGIGIDSGEMVAGSVGSPERLEFTVIGNAANIASRIEALNKEFGTTLLISQSVYDQVELDGAARPMTPVHVKGVSEPIVVYRVE